MWQVCETNFCSHSTGAIDSKGRYANSTGDSVYSEQITMTTNNTSNTSEKQ